MPGQFPEEETEKVVILVHQLVNAIFRISKTDVPRVRVWKYAGELSGASRVARFIKYMFRTNDELSGMDQLKILGAIKKRLKSPYAEQFESQVNLTLKVEFVKRLKALHTTWMNTEKQP
jgi:hypothetical protein